MKKHISVFGLYARSSIFKVLFILFAMCIAEIAIFHFVLQDACGKYEAEVLTMDSLARMFENAHTYTCFRIAFILITIVICLPGCAFKSQTDNTLRRLSISEPATVLHQAAYNVIVYFLFLAVQLAVVFALSQYYVTAVPEEYVGQMTIFLAFYKNSFLHSLLPLDEVRLWFRNGLLIFALGIATAEYSYKQRSGKFSFGVIVLGIFTVLFFARTIGDTGSLLFVIIVSLIITCEFIYALTLKNKEVA